MSLDEHGMPMPDERLLPIAVGEYGEVVDRDGEEIEFWVDPVFFAHAANNIVECRDIVRRLAEKYAKAVAHGTLVTPEMRDASKLWIKMRREVKGDGE